MPASATRLSALDASFLAVESPTAHMHVGWAATFSPPEGRPRPTFEELFEHIRGRLSRDARYRQRLAPTPLRLNAPLWIDDDTFDAEQHIVPASSATLSEAVDDCMSHQLDRDRPLWQLCIADQLDDGRIGVVGKAHHCMVDGIAAVELAALLLDPTPEPMPSTEEDGWHPAPGPDALAGSPEGCSTRCGPTSACCACPRARCGRRPTRSEWRRTAFEPRVPGSACCAPRRPCAP